MFSSDRLSEDKCPIDEYKRHILYLLDKGRILIVVGETGSGKSTRISQFLLLSGSYNASLTGCIESETKTHQQQYKQICITQPRRVAAIQLAQRVSHELKCDLGSTVGYAVRFQDVTNPEETMIKFMTEGLLVREMMSDPLLKKYSVIMVDEVHERNVNTDILLSLLRCIMLKRNDLKLIICSATANIDEIHRFFSYPPSIASKQTAASLQEPSVLLACGKSYPLKIYYTKEPVANYLDRSVDTVKNIHENSRLASGKILIFLTGQDEVEYVCELLNDYADTCSNRLDLQQLLVLPLHASMKPEEISRAFDEHGRNTRVCIVSTNVAETSLTIANIAYVIDCGFVKLKVHDCKTGIDALVRVPISKSSAKQRAGRAGRTREGIVYRLYPESEYKTLRENTTPEIQRSPLMEIFTLLKSLGVKDVTKFPLMSRMPKINLIAALELLYALQAIDDLGSLTDTGTVLAQLNLDPRLAKMLVSRESAGCTREACRIVAILQVKDIYSKPGRHASDLWSNSNLVNLCATEGDIISYLNILNSFIQNQKSQKWAERRHLNYQALLNAVEISSKLESQLINCGLSITSSSGRTELIQKSVVSGLFTNAAYLHPSGDYKTIKGDQIVHIHPTSVYNTVIDRPKLVLFAEILNTTKIYMRTFFRQRHIITLSRQAWKWREINILDQNFRNRQVKFDDKTDSSCHRPRRGYFD